MLRKCLKFNIKSFGDAWLENFHNACNNLKNVLENHTFVLFFSLFVLLYTKKKVNKRTMN
jgi:hypothetical protein